MRAGGALLDPADVQGGRSEVHLLPVGHKDHGGVSVVVTIVPGGLDQPLLDLSLREMLAGAQVPIRRFSGRLG